MKYNYQSGSHLMTIHVHKDLLFENNDMNPITAIYKNAAENLGIDYDTTDGTFRSGEILVSEDIGDQALEIMREQKSNEYASSAWLMFGPKTNIQLPDGTIAISDRFFAPPEGEEYV